MKSVRAFENQVSSVVLMLVIATALFTIQRSFEPVTPLAEQTFAVETPVAPVPTKPMIKPMKSRSIVTQDLKNQISRITHRADRIVGNVKAHQVQLSLANFAAAPARGLDVAKR